MHRALGLGDTTAVVIGAIIGVGIFFTPAQVAKLAGSEAAALGLWGLGGVIAALGAWTFAELGKRYPRAGGQYDVLRDAWGPLAGFLYVFCNLTAIQSGSIAIIAWYCAQNFAAAAGATLSPGVNLAAAVVLIAGLSAANIVGVRAGAGVQNVTVVSKLLTLVAIVAIAVVYPGEPPVAAGTPVSGETGLALLAGLLPAMFAYGGWQQALWMGGEVKDPERTLPRAILGGVGVVIVVYLGAAWAYFRLLGFDGVSGAGALAFEAVGTTFPGWGARVAAGAVGVSAFGVLNAQLLTGPRLVWALAEDGRFFAAFRGVHARWGTPVPAILLLGGLGAGLLLVAGADGIEKITAWSVAIDALFFALTGLALVRFLGREGRLGAAAAIPFGFALLELCGVAGAVASESVRAAAASGAAWIAVATIVYFVRFRDR
jgi:APA family basic amino acid/polyamine antiporter